MNTSPAGSSPLEQTLRGLGAAADRLVLAPEPGLREAPAGWLVQDPPGLLRAVRTFGRFAGTDETAVATSLFCQAWAVSVTRAAIACLVGARRVPDVASSNTDPALRRRGPAGRDVTLITPRFAAVAGDDDAAADPRAEILPDDDALFDWARSRIFDGHLAPLVEALHDLSPVGPATAVGQRRRGHGRRVRRAVGAADAAPSTPTISCSRRPRLLDAPGSPTEGLAEVFPVPHDGGTRLFVRRQTCCLRYRLPDAPPTCLSCRLLPESERTRRIALRLDEAS